MGIPYVFLGIAYAFTAAVQPGPFQAFLLAETLRRGWKRALPAAFAPLASDGPIAAVVLTVLSEVPKGWLSGLQAAGGVLLLALAAGAFGTWRRARAEGVLPALEGRTSFLRAVAVNFVNPGPWLGWSLVMGPLLLGAWRTSPAQGVGLLAGFYTTMILVTVGLMILFSEARRLGPRVTRGLLLAASAVLALLGVFMLGSGMLGLAGWRR